MGKYMITGSYTLDGLKGLMKDGGSARREAVEKLVASLGGTVESVYFCFGSDDFVVISDMPDNVSAAGASLIAASSGAINARTVPLLTPEEVDAATRVSADYRPPGA